MSTTTTAAPQREPVDVGDPGEAARVLWQHMSRSDEWFRRAGRAWRRDPGTGQPRAATTGDVRTWAGLRLRPYKVNAKGEARPADVSPGLASMVLEPEPGALPEIEAVRTHAFVRPSGTLAQGRGYDAETRTWIEPVMDHKPVSAEPTTSEVVHARAVVADYFRGWTFQADSDRAALLAMHMDPVLRRFIGGLAPGVFITASSPASGKSYGAETMAEMFGGRMIDGNKSPDMLGKQLTTTMAQAGYLAVLIADNLKNGSTFDSPTISGMLTAKQWTDRAVMTSTQVEVSGLDRPLIVATVNNGALGGDNGSRFVPVRLGERNTDTPAREYDDAELCAALLTLARAYVLAGAPRRRVSMRQFTPWLSTMAGFCDWYGYAGLFADHAEVIASMDREAAEYERLGVAALDRIATGKVKADADGWTTARAITSDPVLQDLLPRLGMPADKHIGHRSAGRDVLGPRVGRRDGAVRLERRWDSHAHRFLYRWVRAVRSAAASLRERAAAVLDRVRMMARPAVPGTVLSAPVPADRDVFGLLGPVGPAAPARAVRVGTTVPAPART